MMSRRALFRRSLLGAVAAAVRPVPVSAQRRQPGLADTSNLFAGMDPTAARSVRLPPKPGAAPSMSADERDALEHRIACQCGCTLDVFTCRTTDFTCQVSPAMHRDVIALVAGGYDENEILDAFVDVYGDRVLMAPPKEGFNILGYVAPGVALAIGAIVLAVMMRGWRRASLRAAAPLAPALDASSEELARLEEAIRDDS